MTQLRWFFSIALHIPTAHDFLTSGEKIAPSGQCNTCISTETFRLILLHTICFFNHRFQITALLGITTKKLKKIWHQVLFLWNHLTCPHASNFINFCVKYRVSSFQSSIMNNYPSQSQMTQKIQWTNQNSKQLLGWRVRKLTRTVHCVLAKCVRNELVLFFLLIEWPTVESFFEKISSQLVKFKIKENTPWRYYFWHLSENCFKNSRSFYYMASSMRGKRWIESYLATSAGWWCYLAQSGLPAVFRKWNFPQTHVINPLTKLACSVFVNMWTRLHLSPLACKRKHLMTNIQPSCQNKLGQ